jgi:hypothetical protein
MTAHLLTKVALQTSTEEIWIEDYPIFFHDIVIAKNCMI